MFWSTSEYGMELDRLGNVIQNCDWNLWSSSLIIDLEALGTVQFSQNHIEEKLANDD